METQAQGHVSWTPYEGQLRMQAFAHIANGANGVLYWHWHSIHNGMETYWRGLLSHDLQENRLYREAGTIGADFGRLSGQLLNLKKKNKVAILVSNDSLTALSHFPFFPVDAGVGYNDVVRQYADALYEWNVEYDILSDETEDFSAYQMVLVPVLYSARGALLKALETYVQQGGHLVVSFKSGYADENLSVYPSCQPHVLGRCLGISYQEYTVPVDVQLQGKADGLEPYTRDLSEKEKAVFHWMELIQPKEARILAGYQHPYWGKYAAVTENIFGKGTAYYVGCHTSDAFLRRLLKYCLDRVPGMPRDLPTFPIHVHTCFETTNRKVYFIFNYSKSVQRIVYPFEKGISLLSGKEVQAKCNLELAPWGVDIIENIEQE